MVSLPVIPQDSTVSGLFPAALGGMAYIWNTATSSYDMMTKMEPKKGYWLAIPATTNTNVSGLPLTIYTTHFPGQGWYMIGGVLGTYDFINPNDNPNHSVLSPVYGWDITTLNYIQTTALNEKEGYWVAVFGECDLTVGGSGGWVKVEKSEQTDWKVFFNKHGKTPPAPPSIQRDGLESVQIPKRYGMSQNYPNPFNPETTIGYQMPDAGYVSLVIYNMMGRAVRHLVDGNQPSGYHRAVWDGRDDRGNAPGNGIYLVRMEAGSFKSMRKVMLVK